MRETFRLFWGKTFNTTTTSLQRAKKTWTTSEEQKSKNLCYVGSALFADFLSIHTYDDIVTYIVSLFFIILCFSFVLVFDQRQSSHAKNEREFWLGLLLPCSKNKEAFLPCEEDCFPGFLGLTCFYFDVKGNIAMVQAIEFEERPDSGLYLKTSRKPNFRKRSLCVSLPSSVYLSVARWLTEATLVSGLKSLHFYESDV